MKRIENDLIGELSINSEDYCGIHTHRAKSNFNISSYVTPIKLIHSLALVKKAACITNISNGFINNEKGEAITQACDEIKEGKLDDCFKIDALQGGAGTSTNMNINEVIANRALEILGEAAGNYNIISPYNTVNLHQSTNDVYPTALKITIINELRTLSEDLALLQGSFQEKEQEFRYIPTIARTELQDAVPITLGAIFSSFAEAFARDRWRTFKAEERIRVVNIGGTAVGTGITAPQKYIFEVIDNLRKITNLGIARAENSIDCTSNNDTFVEVSAILKSTAVNFIKISKDLRLLQFTNEIELPAVQSGSSIMPGKVNPVILESIIQAGIKVKANDIIISDCVSDGTLQLNEYMPLITLAIIESLELLSNMAITLTKHIKEIKANEDICLKLFESNPTIITVLVPYIGYEQSQELIKEYHNSEYDNVKLFLMDKLGEEIIEELLAPEKLISLGHR
jgi:aspartate ammonia-lyase